MTQTLITMLEDELNTMRVMLAEKEDALRDAMAGWSQAKKEIQIMLVNAENQEELK